MSTLCIDTYTQLILPLIECPVKDAVIKAETLVNKTFYHEVCVKDLTPVDSFLEGPLESRSPMDWDPGHSVATAMGSRSPVSLHAGKRRSQRTETAICSLTDDFLTFRQLQLTAPASLLRYCWKPFPCLQIRSYELFKFPYLTNGTVYFCIRHLFMYYKVCSNRCRFAVDIAIWLGGHSFLDTA